MLKNKLELAAFTVKQAEDDADVLIVNTLPFHYAVNQLMLFLWSGKTLIF